MEHQLRHSRVRYERWPALRGTPSLLSAPRTLSVASSTFLNRSLESGRIGGWGTIATYLSHLTPIEHRRALASQSGAAFLILQVDTRLDNPSLPDPTLT